jgi:hypothetical protein
MMESGKMVNFKNYTKKKDKHEGYGVLTYSNGSYEGNFENDKKKGKGKYISTTITYDGEFEENELTGTGKIITINGNYEGTIKRGLKHGKGRLEYSNGNVYEGEWVDNLRCGSGVLKKKNGTK